jgi:hypothetical protein
MSASVPFELDPAEVEQLRALLVEILGPAGGDALDPALVVRFSGDGAEILAREIDHDEAFARMALAPKSGAVVPAAWVERLDNTLRAVRIHLRACHGATLGEEATTPLAEAVGKITGTLGWLEGQRQ